MPPLPVITNGWYIRQLWVSSGFAHKGMTSFCVTNSTGNAEDLANESAAQWASHVLPVLSDSMALDDTQIVKLDGSAPFLTFTTPSAGTSGGSAHGANAICTANDCVVTTLRSAVRGRSHRGRMYLPPPHYGQLASAPAPTLSPAFVTALASGMNAWLLGLAGATHPMQLEVLSRKLGSITPVLNITVNGHLTSQRRRMEKVAHR